MDPSQIAALPPEVLAQYPARPPPPGKVSNLVDPYDRGPRLVAGISIILALTLALYGARIYAKAFVARKWSWDDLTVSLSLPLTLTYFGAFVRASMSGPLGKHVWNISALELLFDKNWLIPQFMVIALGPPALGFVKITLFLFYLQIFWPLRWLRMCVYIGGSFTAVFYLAMTIVQIYYAAPHGSQTWATHQLSPEYMRSQRYTSPIVPSVGLAIDLFLLVIPVRAIQQLKIQKKTKIGLSLMFAIGILACVMSILNVYWRIVFNRDTDITWITMEVIVVTLVEILVGTMIACMPGLKKALSHHLPSSQSVRSRLTLLRTRYFKSKSHVQLSDTPDFSDEPSSRGKASSAGESHEMRKVAKPVFEGRGNGDRDDVSDVSEEQVPVPKPAAVPGGGARGAKGKREEETFWLTHTSSYAYPERDGNGNIV